MARNRNTNVNGESFDETTVQKVWNKGTPIAEEDEAKFRRDTCGKRIKRSLHGKTEVEGWEIDHIKPVAKGGGDELGNLQPLLWSTNRDKSDQYPWSCP